LRRAFEVWHHAIFDAFSTPFICCVEDPRGFAQARRDFPHPWLPPDAKLRQRPNRAPRGKAIVRETGGWHLDAIEQQPGNLDAHVAELFGRVNNDLSAWATLSGEYRIDLFCVYFMGEADEVVQASPETLKVLGDRRIKLGLRIYSPAEEDCN
jgi:hypothetical protein